MLKAVIGGMHCASRRLRPARGLCVKVTRGDMAISPTSGVINDWRRRRGGGTWLTSFDRIVPCGP